MNLSAGLTSRKRVFGFSLAFLATAAIAGFLIAFTWHTDATSIVNPPELNTHRLLKTGKEAEISVVLLNRLNALTQADKQYAKLLAAGDTSQLDATNKYIQELERKLRITIDSVFSFRVPGPDTNLNKLMNDIILCYRTVLENRNSISALRMNLNRDSKSPQSDIEYLVAQEMLQEKADSLKKLKERSGRKK